VCNSVCGDGKKASNEDCDDGNGDELDGCSPTCTIEYGFYCYGTEPSDCNSDCFDNL